MNCGEFVLEFADFNYILGCLEVPRPVRLTKQAIMKKRTKFVGQPTNLCTHVVFKFIS
jgi:hypothetical protein